MGVGFEGKEAEGLGVAFFDEGAGGVFDDPSCMGIGLVPVLDEVKHVIGVVFGEVVEVVGDGLADVKGVVGAEGLEDGLGEGGVLEDGVEFKGPGEAWAAAFGGEAADMVAGVGSPGLHDGNGAGEVVAEEFADGEL